MNRLKLLILLCLSLVGSSRLLPAADAPDLGGVSEKHEMIPMRDGVRLSAYVYTPPGDGPWPVLLEQRYANANDPGTRQYFAQLAKTGGYVTVLANFRGSQKSEGDWRGYRSLGWGERKDGYDLVEWLGTQTWSTGKVGTFGSSQAGFAQNFLAVTRPPHLTAQYMIDTGLSLFHEGYRIGGITRPERFKSLDKAARVPEHNRELLAEWFTHPTYDSYWADEDCTRFFDQMNVPCFTVGSWYDFMCVGSVDSYVGRQHRGGPQSRGTQQLLLGPWLHSRFKETNKSGDLTYPENAKFPMDAHMIRWFDHYLKGINNGVTTEPTVRYYVMGAVDEEQAPGNEWRTATDWPIAAIPTFYYPEEGGKLGNTIPQSTDSIVNWLADPHHPAVIPTIAFPGAKDAREFEKQPNVLTFTTEVLTQPVEWTGKVQADLWITSDAKDTDVIVRVSDVYPDGRSILIMDYVRRARYREGYDRELLLTPGKAANIRFDVGWLSQIFNAGHRIRITVASTGAPFYESNPNTGEPLTIDFPKNAVVAKNGLQVNQRLTSRIIAPVILR
jgi:predicted acyl esterase